MTTETKQKNTETEIPEGWVETTLGDSVEILDGDRGSNYPNGDDFSSLGYCCFLNTKNVPGRDFDFSATSFISKEKDELLRKGKLNRGDFVLTTRGTIGNFAFYGEKIPYDDMRINSGMVIFRTREIDDSFFKFYLGGSLFNHQVLSLQSGSAQPQLPIRDLKTFRIFLPPLPEQKAIADVLSSLDDKIELLREQNITLEKTAQTIFKEWFGKYQVGDELPEGWRVGKLYEFGEIVCGKTPSKNNKQNFGGSIPFIKIPDMHTQMFILNTTDSLSETGSASQSKKLLPENSICVSCIATVGLVSLVTVASHTNQQINSIIPKESFSREYLYLLMKGMKKKLNDLGGGGTATLNVNTGTFMELDVLIPDTQSLSEFSTKIKPLFEKIKDNSRHGQTLSKTRDTLLPKLMKGIIRVDEENL